MHLWYNEIKLLKSFMQIFVGNTINTFLLKNKKIFFSEYTKKFYIYKANNFLKLNFQQIYFQIL